jgi:hypothetical protein
MIHQVDSARVLQRDKFVAVRDTKNYTVYARADVPEEKLHHRYLPKGLPQTLELWVVVPETSTPEQSK